MFTKQTTLKPSAGRATGSTDRTFSRAVLRLTGVYALGVFVVLVVFTALVYILFIGRIFPEYENDPFDTLTPAQQEIINHAHELQEELISILISADVVLFVVTLGVGYGLARTTLAPIEASYQRQQRFVAESAHELRTPLAVLTAGADHVLARDRPKDEYQTFTHVVREEAGRLTRLANNLLLLTRRDEGAPTPPMVAVDLSHLTERTCTHMQWYTTEHGCTLSCDIRASCTVACSPDLLTELLQNLVKNAVDYNRPQGTVAVTLSGEDTVAVLRVADTGIGIPKAEQAAVFERFHTVRGAPKNGAGLGLSIVRAVVEEHRGTVTLASDEGGTTVTVRLPMLHSS